MSDHLLRQSLSSAENYGVTHLRVPGFDPIEDAIAELKACSGLTNADQVRKVLLGLDRRIREVCAQTCDSRERKFLDRGLQDKALVASDCAEAIRRSIPTI